jgi:hypothetical protein
VKKIYLFGEHVKRTPFAYPEYRKLFRKNFEYAERPEDADFLVFGVSKNIEKDAEEVRRICSVKPGIRLVVLSEEPLWDTVWSGDVFSKKADLSVGDQRFSYHVLNHCTTKIYDFEKFPYFVTTGDDYFARYSYLFSRHRACKSSELKRLWARAPIRAAFYAEARVAARFDIAFPEQDIAGLCRYRTLIAKKVRGEGVVRVGQKWTASLKRQLLPDWHLDKLATLDRRSFIVSALENTHHCQYITEKIFDAFAVLAIPLYFAGPRHSVKRLVPQSSFINLYGLSVREAVDRINSFEPDNDFLELYCQAQARLTELFSNPSAYVQERKRVVAEVVSEFQSLCQ